MKLLDDYFDLQRQIHDYFGYEEDWVVIPLSDETEYYWRLTGEGLGDEVLYAEDKELVGNYESIYYSAEIYTQPFLPKWVYRAADYTMVCADTHTDGNKFLMVFDNTKEVKDQ